MIETLKMIEFMEQFEELLDKVVNIADDKDFQVFKNKVIDRLNEID